MTPKQWEQIGGLADQEYVDFDVPAHHDIEGWAKEVRKLGYITEEEVEEFGGWEALFFEACEWA